MSGRPRVFYVVGSLAADDTGEEIVAILGRLSRAAFEPRVVVLGGPEDLRERIARMKVRVYTLGLSGPLGMLWAVWKVRRLLRAMDADVVHGFGTWGGAVAELAAPKGAVVVRTVSGPPDPGPGFGGWLLGRMGRRAAARPGTHFVVPAEPLCDVVALHYGARDVSVVPTSLDVAAVRTRLGALDRTACRLRLGVHPGDVLFVCLTDFRSTSAMEEILGGLAVARREAAGIRLFLLGSGVHEDWSRGRAEELRLDDAVVFLGSDTDADTVWAAADVVVDSVGGTGWSRGALVSHAVGLPVVRQGEGSVRGGLEGGTRPPVVSGSADWFGSDLVRLAESAELRERVRLLGQGVAGGNDVARVTEELQYLYERLKGGRMESTQ